MRNCFVPHCDAFCKKNGILKRMMFSAPKDNFESWKNRLFNKREFRETDRVCERHFDKTQILTHWQHIIDGKVCELEREKPKIKSSAVPYLNLPETEIIAITTNKKRAAKLKPEPKRRKQNNTNSDQTDKVTNIQHNEDDECDTAIRFEEDNIEVENDQKTIGIKNGGADSTNNLIEEKRQIFDAVYDDIYEVVLPNENWGIHRDPDRRRYIAFTMFDAIKMNCSVAIKITNAFDLKVYANGVHKTNEILPELSVDIITKLVNQINESAEQGLEKVKTARL
ncbi:uncharacterized protein LOC116340451 [Contarinia nasturtii]|uniref:uncharacterized protein LOC116340451 n=1 Tax=Contarinia nasturtii TaxID=265458 RepID=UPI0012D40878|nr:uncharacterized protein LOC116340451 [Contarinia nasturtii]